MSKQSSKLDLTPKNNFIFKKIFATPGNESILEDLLSAILNENINSVKLVQGESEHLGSHLKSRTFRFDIKIILPDGRINIRSIPIFSTKDALWLTRIIVPS